MVVATGTNTKLIKQDSLAFIMDLETLKKALKASWAKDTCYYPDYDPNNPSYGQCFATVLVVNDYLGGKICKKKWGEEFMSSLHFEKGNVRNTNLTFFILLKNCEV